jgi:hypothetical protein
MIRKIAQLVTAVMAVATLVTGGIAMSSSSTFAGTQNSSSASSHDKAKPPCTRCCLKTNPKTHRCEKYGYRRGTGKCRATCK